MPYHINPVSGETGLCRAKTACPFSPLTDHFDSPESARTFFEAVMEGRVQPPLSWLLSPRGHAIEAPADLPVFTEQCYEASKTMRAELSREQRHAIGYYTMGGFEAINGVLRGQDKDCYGAVIDEARRKHAEKRIGEIDAAFELAKETPRVVYRYASTLNGETVRATLKAIESQATYHEPGFLSTSASVDYPGFKVMEKRDERFLVELVTRRSLDLQVNERMHQGDIQSQELEVLVPRNSTFEVVGVEWRKQVPLTSIKEVMLPRRDWEDSPAEKRIRKSDHALLPVLRLIQH